MREDSEALSTLRFTVRPTRAWSSESGFSGALKHQSDMYIFCVLAETNRKNVDPLALDQWEFYPVLTIELAETLHKQKTAGMSTIQRLCPEKHDYRSLHDGVLWLFSGRSDLEARDRIDAHKALKRASMNG